MNQKLKLTLKSISHSGSHIGRDITVHVVSSELGFNVEIKKNVLPDKTTFIDKELYNSEIKTDKAGTFNMLLEVAVTERDALFDDKGLVYQHLYINTDTTSVSEHTVVVEVHENRFFFWKRSAKFNITLTADVIVPTKTEEKKKIPTVSKPEWTGDFNDDTDQMILARALFGEMRSTLVPDEARYAVAYLIKNRVAEKQWFDSYVGVITQDRQFSAFNKNDPNRAYVENPLHTGNSVDKKAWRHAYSIAGRVLGGESSDTTGGANHYYDDSMDTPYWAEGNVPIHTVSYANQHNVLVNIFFFRL